MRALCYCCPQIANTVEHVPPQRLFLEQKDLPPGIDLRRNLITVPSCEEHNLRKSGDDAYLMFVLAMNLPSGVAGQEHFSTKIVRAIKRRPSLVNRLLSKATPVALRDARTDEVFDTLAIPAEGERLERTLEKVALGLYRHHLALPWQGKLRVVPEFMHYLQDERSSEWNQAMQEASGYANALFAQSPYFGSNPSIFRYQIVNASPSSPAAIRLHFYGEGRVLAVNGATDA